VYDRTIANHGDMLSVMFAFGPSSSTFLRSAKDMAERYYDDERREECIVDKVEWVSERKLRIMFAQPRRDSPYKPPDIVVQIIFDDVIKVLSGPNNDQVKLLYRISSFLKEPVQRAFINADGVRFRVKPNVESDIWLLFDEGYRVEVLGWSAGKEKIGNVEAYWYEVRCYIEGFKIDGWVFGSYLDLEDPDYFDG
jgi:hypothetical protein